MGRKIVKEGREIVMTLGSLRNKALLAIEFLVKINLVKKQGYTGRAKYEKMAQCYLEANQ